MRKIYFISCLVLITSCNSTAKNSVDSIHSKDSITLTNGTDSLKTQSNRAVEEHYETDNNQTTEKIIRQKYGVQWDFCDCIVKNDSIQNAIDLAGDIDDAEFDVLISRFEEIDQHCKSIIASPNTTPDERKAHERRVKKCLKKNT